MASIADVFFKALLDDGQLQVDASKAGDKAGQTLGSRMSGGAKAGLKVFAGVVATGFAAATAQGLQLNEVLGNLQASTGATGADWEAMQKVVRRENGRTTESIDEIASATKSMREDLGLTGEGLDKYADKIFDAGLVTHTSATQITGSVDDIVDGFHVGIDRALGDLDKLEVSQQRFGGSLQARLDVLPKLAGALGALNRTEDDGIALLNAAASAGLDATDVQTALTAAVNKFKIPPALKDIIGVQDQHANKVQFARDEVVKLEAELAKFVVPDRLREIIATLDKIEDPTLRAAAAEKIYNDEVAKVSADPLQTILDTLGAIPDQQARVTKAQELGLGKSSIAWATLAGQIADTTGGLDGYKISTEDATGAIEDQARAIDAGPIRSLKLMGETIGALFANAGSNPIVTGIASLGTILGGFAPNLVGKLATGMFGALKGLGMKLAAKLGIEFASSAVTGVATATGETIGNLTTKAIEGRLAGGTLSKALASGLIGITSPAREAAMAAGIGGSRIGRIFGAAMAKVVAAGEALADALSAMWTKVASSGPMQTAIGGAGKFMGSTLGKVASVAFAAVLVVEAIDTFNRVKSEIAAQVAALIAENKKFMQVATDDQIKASIAGLREQANQLSQADLGEIIFGKSAAKALGAKTATDLADSLQDELSRRLAANAGLGILQFANGLPAKIGAALLAGKPALAKAASGLAGAATDAWNATAAGGFDIGPSLASRKGWATEMHAAANRAAAAVAQGIREKRVAVEDSWQLLMDTIKNVQTPSVQRAKLLGELTSKELAKALKSGRPEVAEQARATKQDIIDQLTALGANSRNIGEKGMEMLRKGMKSKDPDIRAASTAIFNAANSKIKGLPGAGSAAGKGAGQGVASGLNSKVGVVETAAGRIADAVIDNLYRLAHIGGGHARAAGGPVMAGQTYTVGEHGPETFVPNTSGTIVPFSLANAVPNMNTSRSGGAGATAAAITNVTNRTNNFNISLVESRSPDPFEVPRQLRRLAEAGTFDR